MQNGLKLFIQERLPKNVNNAHEFAHERKNYAIDAISNFMAA